MTEDQEQKTEAPAESFSIMERADEAMIEKEIKGEFLDQMVYSFEIAGKRIVGLSWVGVKEVVRRMGNIRVLDPMITETDTLFQVICKARDEIRNLEMFGVSRQSKKARRKDGSEYDDEFALHKALSKAQRNAIRAVIPEVFIKTAIDEFLLRKNSGAPTRTPTQNVQDMFAAAAPATKK